MIIALDTTQLPPGAMSEALAEDELAVVMREGHPKAQAEWRLEDYARYPSVAIALLGEGTSDLDAELARKDIRRRIAVVVPSFSAAVAIVAQTDFVTTISRAYAQRFASSFSLVLREPPLRGKRLGLVTVWSGMRHGDRTLAWLRGIMRKVAQSS